MMEIKKLDELIKANLPSDKQLLCYKCKNLLSTGENYGSILLNIKIKLKNSNNGEEETVYWVAKVAPPSQFLWDFFNISVTFNKEVGAYNVIMPTLNEYGREKGLGDIYDIFAGYYGSRRSLDPNSDKVDGDAVLLLDNLKVKDYVVKDRFVGFDEACTRFLLRELAVMHTTPIAFKLERPKEFKEKMMPFLSRDFFFETDDEQMAGYVKTLRTQALLANPDTAPYLDMMEKKMLNMTKTYRTDFSMIHEPYATLIHGDFWVNNTLLKFENGLPVNNKIVDFQLMEYNSPANDVVFFLYSSVDLTVLKNRVEEFLKIYHDEFIAALKKFGTDTTPFTYEKFLAECKEVAWKIQLCHLLFMHIPMFTVKGKAKELTEWSTKDLAASNDSLHECFGKRLSFILMDFARLGWI